MTAEYTVIIFTPQELNHSSYIQTGLFELENSGFINVKVKLSIKKNLGRTVVLKDGTIQLINQQFQKASYYKLIKNSTGKSMLFTSDLYDAANVFSTKALEICDVVFKRNFELKYINFLPRKHKKKIFKQGMSFGVHSEFKRKETLFFLGLLLSNLNANIKVNRLVFKRLYNTYVSQLNHWQFIKTSRNLKRFENFHSADKNVILFQTRCFLREDQQDVIDIHEQRYQLITLLKSHFPNQFKGGFIPSKIANEKYSDALSNVPSNPEMYLDVLKSAKIVIYTRGLVNSPAWKMAEYLSQGKVIIAEPLTVELPVPLVHGNQVLFFTNNEELIKNIQLVLSNNSLCDNLSKNARTYFEKNVHPTQNVKRMLEFLIAKF